MIKTTPVDLSKLGDIVKIDAVKKIEYDELVEKVNGIQVTDTSDLDKKAEYDTKVTEIKK